MGVWVCGCVLWIDSDVWTFGVVAGVVVCICGRRSPGTKKGKKGRGQGMRECFFSFSFFE